MICIIVDIMVIRAANFPTVGSHDVNSQDFNLRVSNPRTTAYFDFEMPFESSPRGRAHFSRLNFWRLAAPRLSLPRTSWGWVAGMSSDSEESRPSKTGAWPEAGAQNESSRQRSRPVGNAPELDDETPPRKIFPGASSEEFRFPIQWAPRFALAGRSKDLRGWAPRDPNLVTWIGRTYTISPHKFKSRHLRGELSNPRIPACLDLKVPVECVVFVSYIQCYWCVLLWFRLFHVRFFYMYLICQSARWKFKAWGSGTSFQVELSKAGRKTNTMVRPRYTVPRAHLRPISVLRFWISEGLTQAWS